MTKEIVAVEFIMKTYDTSKMDMWSKEQWNEWVGEPDGNTGIQIPLINDNEFYLKVMGIYYNEETKEMFFGFDAQNKLDRNINIHYGDWKIDESTFNLSCEKPYHLKKCSEVRGYQKSVERTHLESWDSIIIEVNLLDAETNLLIREFEFQIEKRLVQVF
ncbi:hypothetical protein QWT69_14070 [Sporosarcina oncorhynchi]|uniref:Uncharacterized protein n=1 Tax=Sporosarcina oncorhynchi TaxID=3056444 RepID=A0ABZ0L382_9BACL|nr:hypothetical protein [Sporosarcina sp. T2O-4]WOV86986.1 hypothetical protein QWT69_14070 [Sporosarcina sp. T2O-4]